LGLGLQRLGLLELLRLCRGHTLTLGSGLLRQGRPLALRGWLWRLRLRWHREWGWRRWQDPLALGLRLGLELWRRTLLVAYLAVTAGFVCESPLFSLVRPAPGLGSHALRL
jgi:hypothetical protein